MQLLDNKKARQQMDALKEFEEDFVRISKLLQP